MFAPPNACQEGRKDGKSNLYACIESAEMKLLDVKFLFDNPTGSGSLVALLLLGPFRFGSGLLLPHPLSITANAKGRKV